MLSLSKSKFIPPLAVHDALHEKGVALFTPQEFSRIFKVSSRQTRYFLEAYTKRGLLVRLKQGLYALKEMLPNEEVVANALYKPSYISLEYALARYGVIPEMPYTITSVTTRATASFSVRDKEFSYKKIKREAFTGYRPERIGEQTIFIADPEKALADYLYFVSLGKKTLNDRLMLRRLEHKKILSYAKLFGREGLNELVKDIIKIKPT